MKFPENDRSKRDRIDQEAAEWLARIDEGLSGEEQDAYVEWLSQDERHRTTMSLMQWGWGELDRLAGLQFSEKAPVNPGLLATDSAKHKSLWSWFLHNKTLAAGLAIAALLIFSFGGILLFNEGDSPSQHFEPAYELMARLTNIELEDGSSVELNRGATIKTRFTKEKRLVFLEGGEANFIVAEDSTRPFVVSVGGIEVRAVGTIFNVKYVGRTVDVIVSEGKVQVEHQTGLQYAEEDPSTTPMLTAGQKATIQIAAERPVVTLQLLDKQDLEDALKWQPRLLKFNATPLDEIINGFNRHNQIQVELGDPELGKIILTSAFWSDNVEGFVRLMENNFGMRVVWVDRHRIRLVSDGHAQSVL